MIGRLLMKAASRCETLRKEAIRDGRLVEANNMARRARVFVSWAHLFGYEPPRERSWPRRTA